MERRCFAGHVIPRGNGFVRDDISLEARRCGVSGSFKCPYCRKCSNPNHATVNLARSDGLTVCPFCERRISLTNDSGRFEDKPFELAAAESISLDQLDSLKDRVAKQKTETETEEVRVEPQPSQTVTPEERESKDGKKRKAPRLSFSP